MSSSSARCDGGRLGAPDLLRGVTVCSMIAYHACWDLVNLFGRSWAWFEGTPGFLWQQSICWAFLLLSGFCWGMSRHGVRRGLIVFAGGALVSAATWLAEPEEPVFFGVLTLLGAAMVALTPAKPLLRRVPAGWGLLACAVIFFLFRNAKDGYLGFGALKLAALPEGLYANLGTACLGFPPAWFYSSDYFPVFPWLFLFAAGYFLWRLWAAHGRPFAECCSRQTPLHAVGRHSLEIYLLHQPVLLGILTALLQGGASVPIK